MKIPNTITKSRYSDLNFRADLVALNFSAIPSSRCLFLARISSILLIANLAPITLYNPESRRSNKRNSASRKTY